MGYLTTVEIAHDFADRIKADPIGFSNLMLELTRVGPQCIHPELQWALAASFGVRLGPMRHSSEPPLIPYGRQNFPLSASPASGPTQNGDS